MSSRGNIKVGADALKLFLIIKVEVEEEVGLHLVFVECAAHGSFI